MHIILSMIRPYIYIYIYELALGSTIRSFPCIKFSDAINNELIGAVLCVGSRSDGHGEEGESSERG